MAQEALTSPARPWVIRLLQWSTDALYGLGVLSILGVAVHVMAVIGGLLIRPISYTALLTVLDPVLLLVMLAELLHTMTLAIQTHHLPLKPVLALLWLALVRHGVVMAATASSLATATAGATLGGVVVLSGLLALLPAHDAD
ncbi:MAG: hypothetical protein C7B43_16700 [Sulfobacillus benefaciens]|uniref:Uncharacterized protein n=1 Tax=Sulfobacillus benefaciens TaxID=453960 RepID=A0A2T2WTH8_9FIRM|nr:MAG: hypothetical protein C7B43_16700 [Sulfobacillus benefaciens]